MLNTWVIISSIGASILESRHLGELSPQRVRSFEGTLLVWRASLQKSTTEPLDRGWDHERYQPLSRFLLLWHHSFISLSVDLNLLEIAVGRDGPNIAPSVLERVKAWVRSPASKRCLFHSLCLQNMASLATADSAIYLHTPRVIFSAALCWYCYKLYLPWCRDSSSTTGPTAMLDEAQEYLKGLPEVQSMLQDESNMAASSSNPSKCLSELGRILEANAPQMTASTLCVLESTLRRLGSGTIAQKLADIVQIFITGETHRVAGMNAEPSI